MPLPFLFGDGYHTTEEIKAILRESEADYDRRGKLAEKKNARPASQTEQSC